MRDQRPARIHSQSAVNQFRSIWVADLEICKFIHNLYLSIRLVEADNKCHNESQLGSNFVLAKISSFVFFRKKVIWVCNDVRVNKL